ncbi:phage tail protein [Mycobacteroides abscessus]|uniref:phage tail protein n=1 Tax=Mycobacteroides abscessus TaxID=36809 RepID=UPI0009A61E04|nr:phage tail protein [Mycobacteroides abscessus]SLG08586.1 Bacteriophage minor tail subunit [Mycobacteroides abscessus subsp. abscessus]
MTTPLPGAPIHLMSWLNMMHIFGVVSDGEVPGLRTCTFEGVNDDIVATVPLLKGEKGDDGLPSPVVDLHINPTITSPTQLPTDLGLNDKGKTWWIGDLLYVWMGTEYIPRPAGYAGRPGPTPKLSFSIELIAPGETSVVIPSGTDLNPHLHFKIAAPRGIPGPAAAIRDALDYNNILPPTDGQVPTWDEEQGKWRPESFTGKRSGAFSIPEAAFTNVTNIINGRIPILSYQLPVWDFPVKLAATGKFKAFGVDLNILDPFKIGAEVRIGDPMNGQIIGRGKGTVAQETTVSPHYSTPGDPTVAMTMENEVALINAGQQATLTANLVNDGLIGMYAFNRQDAQLFVQWWEV